MDHFNEVQNTLLKHKELLIALSDHMWQTAETKFEETKSADYYCELLGKLGFHLERGIGGLPTAFKASFGDEGPVIGFLGEFDALPGLDQKAGSTVKEPSDKGNSNGQGCGHQLLGAGAFGAALALKEQIENKLLHGRVIFYGCPAEEGGSGKAWMVREHCFDESDVLLTWHPGTANMVIPEIFLASIQAVFHFKGLSAHAAACPHLGRSALDAVELMNVGVNFLREHVISDARMHYAIIDAGGNFANIVQPSASVLYQLRAPKMSDVADIYERVQRIAQGAAWMTDTTVEVKFDRCCSNMRLNKTLDKLVYENFRQAGVVPVDSNDCSFAKQIRQTYGDRIVGTDENDLCKYYGAQGKAIAAHLAEKEIIDELYPLEPMFNNCGGSTDVGDVSQVKPVSQIMTACYAKDTPGHSWQIVAQGKTPLAHKAMLHTALILGATGTQLLQEPALLEAVKADFEASYKATPYQWPIPKDAVPPIPKNSIGEKHESN